MISRLLLTLLQTVLLIAFGLALGINITTVLAL